MIRIAALNSEDFIAIQKSLELIDPKDDFLQYFEVAEQCEKVNNNEEIRVVLRNTKKFKMNLNTNKYTVVLPDALLIDSFDFVETYETVGNRRVPFTNVIIKSNYNFIDNEVNAPIKFVIVLTGFAHHNIKIVHPNNCDCGCCNHTTGGDVVPEVKGDEELEEAINDALTE